MFLWRVSVDRNLPVAFLRSKGTSSSVTMFGPIDFVLHAVQYHEPSPILDILEHVRQKGPSYTRRSWNLCDKMRDSKKIKHLEEERGCLPLHLLAGIDRHTNLDRIG